MKWWLFNVCVLVACVGCDVAGIPEIETVVLETAGKFPEMLASTLSTESVATIEDEADPIFSFEDVLFSEEESSTEIVWADSHTFRHAGLPSNLHAFPAPLKNSDHELLFNISWTPPVGGATDYSLEVRSETRTVDCDTPMCYEYNIPGEANWWLVPARANPVAGSCGVRPGCAYSVRLIAHPWDGHTSANINVELDECVAGVCSCAYAPRLPTPKVKSRIVSSQGELFVNVSWTLPPPENPLRLPPALNMRGYYVSIGKQMVSDAHASPWFSNTITRQVKTSGPVSNGDQIHWVVIPLVERGGERVGERRDKPRHIALDVKLLARVSLVDDRNCVGPPGNATAYDPSVARKTNVVTYALWAAFGGACVLAIIAILAIGTRGMKRIVKKLRPAPQAASLEPLRGFPAWLPIQLRP